MKIKAALFIKSATGPSQYPGDDLPEIMFVGRSNVGKSSLINTLLNRRNLAKTSSTPGKTRTINFYEINSEFRFVDLPGYGFAKVSAGMRREWSHMIERYRNARKNIKCAVVVLDIRRIPDELDFLVYKWLDKRDVPAITVVTKTDKLSRNNLLKQINLIKKNLSINEPILFSKVTRIGRNRVWEKIKEFLAQIPLDKSIGEA